MDEAFEATGLRKQYGKVTALDGLDLTIPNGELVGFLGPNGLFGFQGEVGVMVASRFQLGRPA